MRRLLRSVSAAVLIGLLPYGDTAYAKPDESCRPNALEHLRTSSPDGLAIYKQISQPDFFESWIRCDDPQFGLPTAVHESTHFITAETDAFPLVGGGAVKRPHEVSKFFPPSQITRRFKADDLVTTYLRRGKATSSTDFLYLLDELNAYSHDLDTAVDLKELGNPDEAVDHRDGLAAMMAYVAVYAETARESEARTLEARTWRGLREPQVAKVISDLWGRAERVMASSCGIPKFGIHDKYYIRQVCAAEVGPALEQVLGRAPVCPTACLTSEADVE